MALDMAAQVNLSDSKSYGDADKIVPWDNPSNVITFETFIAIEDIINCYVNPLIFCIGVPANVLNCVVFFRQGFYNISILPFLSPPLSYSLLLSLT